MDKNQVAIYVGMNWLVVLCYLAAIIANAFGIIFKNEKAERRSFWPVGLGFAIHSLAIVYWWRIAGHGPYMTPSEVLSSNAWCALVMFFILRRFFPPIRPASIVVFPAVFLMVALGNIYNPGIRTLPPTYGTIWLVIHILLYKISLGTMIVAMGLSVLYLRKSRPNPSSWLKRLPDLDNIDLYVYRFAGFGFVFWGIGTFFLSSSLGMGLLLSTLMRNQFNAAQAALNAAFLPALMLSGFIYEIRSMPA
ncbi:MAG: cytochrome c biogenesis protein CcsA, partial [bacterium]